MRFALIGALLLLACAPAAHAQRIINEPLANDGAAQPIELFADHAATWKEGGKQIYLLRGNVIINQGTTAIRSPDMAVWIDMDRYESERVYHLLVYGDTPLTLERNKAKADADYGYIRLATSSRVDLKTYKSDIAKVDASSDRVYLRALANQQNARTAVEPPPIKAPTAPRFDDQLRPVSGLQPLAPPPMPIGDGTLQKAPQLPRDDGPLPRSVKTFQVPPAPGFPSDGPKAPPGPGPVFPQDLQPAPPSASTPPKTQPQISVRPRYSGDLQVEYGKREADGSTPITVTGSGGVAIFITVNNASTQFKNQTLDIEADRVVIWTKGDARQLFQGIQTPEGDSGAHEVYMAGNVELRTRTTKEVETMRADEIYYDVRRGVAVARKVDLEILSGKLQRPLHIWTEELIQINPKMYKAKGVGLHNSTLPSDPGLLVSASEMTIEERQKERSYLFGTMPAYDKDGRRIVDSERVFTGKNVVTRLEGVPVFYFPFIRGDVEHPLGPLDQVGIGYDQNLGLQIKTTWDLYQLLNLPRVDGTRWRLMLDYLTARGPAFGTQFDYSGKDLLGTKAIYSGSVQLYGMFDRKADVLGGDRGNFVHWPDEATLWPVNHANFRGQAFANVNIQDLPNGFSVLGQMSFLRDKNFREQYFFDDHLNGPNQDTYLYVQQRQGIWRWSIEGATNTQPWMTHTDWLPKAEGNVIGWTLLDDLLVYNARGNLGYARLRPTNQVPFAYLPTDVRRDAGRFDLMQDISLPFDAGPVKVVPYAMFDAAYYTQDVAGDGRGRLWGGGGIRWNMPLSKLYPDVQSDLFNLNGLYHKINLTGNFFYGASSSRYTNFPQFDRLNDDVTDQSLRDIRPRQFLFNPANAASLTTSPIFDPQRYLIRRLIDSNVDTLDQINVVQLGLRQRWQTLRGAPGNEHVVDWMTLNLGLSLFPQKDRDNFGRTVGLVEYDWVWNIGDRTALSSGGWFEPWTGGPRMFDVGAHYQRPDSTAFYVGYRQIDPLNSKAVIGSVTYPFSAKYALTGSTSWDFGTNVRTYSVFVSRMGTDVMMNFGVSYTSTVNTFGVAFELVPNFARRPGRFAGVFPMQPLNIDPMVNTR